MSAPMKKPRIKNEVEVIVRDRSSRVFRLSREKARGILSLIQEHEVHGDDLTAVPADEVFKDLYEKYGRAGTAIRGARSRDGLTQADLAKKLKVTQSDISQMETSRRSVGKKMALRLAQVFKTDYRIFL